MPNYLLHKNFKSYNQFAFNWIGERAEHSTGTAINDWTGFNGIGDTGTYYLTSNIFCNETLSSPILRTFSGTIYFNGYSIFGLNIDFKNRLSVGLFGAIQEAKIYNASIINPQVLATITASQPGYEWFLGSDNRRALNLYVGVLSARMVDTTKSTTSPTPGMAPYYKIYCEALNSAILGGSQRVIIDDNLNNKFSDIVGFNASSAKNYGDIYVDGIAAGIVGNLKTNNQNGHDLTNYHYSTSIYVKTAGATTENVVRQVNGDYYNDDFDDSSCTIELEENYYRIQGADAISGSIKLSNVYIANANSNYLNLVYVNIANATVGNAEIKNIDVRLVDQSYWDTDARKGTVFTPGKAQTGNLGLTSVTVGYSKIYCDSEESTIGGVTNQESFKFIDQDVDNQFIIMSRETSTEGFYFVGADYVVGEDDEFKVDGAFVRTSSASENDYNISENAKKYYLITKK